MFLGSQSLISRLEEFQNKFNLCNVIDFVDCSLNFTYLHESLNQRSHIDFFLVLNNLFNSIVDYHVIAAFNFSDHLPIALIVETNIDTTVHQPIRSRKSKSEQKYYRWDHGDRGKYYELSRNALYPIDQKLDYLVQNASGDIHFDVDNIYAMIVSCLTSCSDASIPKIKKGSLKFWWDQELDELKSNSVMSFRAWQNAGKPRDGPMHGEMTKHRLRYRKGIRDKETESNLVISNDLHESLIRKDFKTFWNCLKNKCGQKANRNISIECFIDEIEIAREFASFFEKHCNAVETEKIVELDNKFQCMYLDYENKSRFDKTYCTDVESIAKIVAAIKEGKATGVDGLMAEHIKYAHPVLIVILKKLFNIMIDVGYVPSAFGCGLIIPIPKRSIYSNFASINDFRGITLSPVLSKLFEHCLLQLFQDSLVSSEFQFGFKKGKGCRDALFIVNETVDYFVSNCSTVSLCAIDLTKAFDNLNHSILFLKLIENNVPFCLIKILKDWYCKCVCNVKWGSSFSQSFVMSQGIRHGGVLSPILFCLYCDGVLNTLNNSGLGCYVAGLMISAVMYADDILLLTPSVEVMQNLIRLCQSSFEDVLLHFNVSKCSALRVGARHKSPCASLEALDGSIIPWVNKFKYLGVVLAQGTHLKVNVHHNKVNFFKSFNNLYGKLGSSCSVESIVHLMKVNCLSAMLYNLESVVLNKSDLNKLEFSLGRAFVKIFHIRDCNSLNWCKYYMNQLPIEMLLDLKRIMYLQKIVNNSDCFILCHMFGQILHASLFELCSKYTIDVAKKINSIDVRIQMMNVFFC